MFEIQFCTDARRKTIPLGKRYTEKTAKELLEVVEVLLHCRANGVEVPSKKTVGWIKSASDEIQDKLAKAGLIVQPQRKTTGELWVAFRDAKHDIKETTLEGYDHAERRFFSFFGTDEALSELTQVRMEQWKGYLRKESPNERTGERGLAGTTTAGTIQKAKAVFNWAKAQGWIIESPLDGVGRGSFVNEEHDRFVTMDEYLRLLDVCPCSDWRVIIALARIGGLRCPSEVLRLKWTDINWQHPARFSVNSTKTARYPGKGSRVVPLFPDLRIELERLFEADSSVGAEFVITRYRDPERTNLGTQFGRIVKMAGIQPIPRPFDNMRASRSSEVYAEYGPFYESKWIGHSRKIAENHYLTVREEDFERAVSGSPVVRAGKNDGKTVFPASEKCLPAFFPAVGIGIDRNGSETKKKESAVNP